MMFLKAFRSSARNTRIRADSAFYAHFHYTYHYYIILSFSCLAIFKDKMVIFSDEWVDKCDFFVYT